MANEQYQDLTKEKLTEYLSELFYGRTDKSRRIKIYPLGPGAQKELDKAMKEEFKRQFPDYDNTQPLPTGTV